MVLATLNISHGGGTRVPALLAYLHKLDADLLVLTEFRLGTRGSALCDGLGELGYGFQASSANRKGENSVLVASRLEAHVIDPRAGPPHHEHRLMLVQLGELVMAGCYFPQGVDKRPVFERLHELSRRLPPLGLVLGDLNTGLPRLDERGTSFKCVDGFEQLLRANLIDAWRSRHPDARDFSWFSARGNGFRIDHALATPEFDKRIVDVSDDHASRARGLTDHSALRVRCDGQWHRPADPRR